MKIQIIQNFPFLLYPIILELLKKLFEHHKLITAIDCAASIFQGNNNILKRLDSQLIADILVEIATKDNTNDSISFSNVRYDITRAIKLLQERHDLPDNKLIQIEWFYLRALEHDRFIPKFLYNALANDPHFFVQLITWLFKRSDGKEDEKKLPESTAKQNIENAYILLRKCNQLPGQDENLINSHVLSNYVQEVEVLLEKAGRLRIGESQLGQYLSHCPVGEDGIWPHEAIRDIIDTLRSESFDSGFSTGKYNQRGFSARSPFDGGNQERVLANKYIKDSEKIRFSYPRTAKILREIASFYEYEATHYDQDVELNI